ncbi:MAG: histidine kinase [Acidobacteriota bacterium]
MKRSAPFLLAILGAAAIAGGMTAWLTGSGFVIKDSQLALGMVRHAVGDDSAWSAPDFDDSEWPKLWFHHTPGSESIQWLRGSLDLSTLEPFPRPLGLELGALATCEIFWDGQLLTPSGVVGTNAAEEVPGRLLQIHYLNEELATSESFAAGRHTVALRCSTHNRGFSPSVGFWYLRVGEYGALVRETNSRPWPATVTLSAMVVVGLFYLLLFALDRRDRSDLVLGAFALTGAALLVAESWRSLVPYTYDWHVVRLLVVTALSGLLNLLLALFFTLRFPRLGHRRAFLAAVVILIALPAVLAEGWDTKAGLMFLGVGLLTLGRGLVATIHYSDTGLTSAEMSTRVLNTGQASAALASAGVACLLAIALVRPFHFLDQTLFVALNVLLMCLLASHALQVRAARREQQAAEVKSVRLEIELLKRHIQPHFLMNTLTAMSEWLEEEPAVAARMIQALAAELRLLGEISGERLIPMRDELRLCRSHLELMSYRQDRRYALNTRGIVEDSTIPPAVFHTLVENAITHDQGTGALELALVARRENGRLRYRFDAPANGAPAEALGEGTGLRYVRARLQESYEDDFAFRYGRVGELWRTEIDLPGSP